MDSDERNKVIAFDTLFCTNHIQMLKVILPYMDSQTQKSMAVYIKFLELNYTIEYFKKHPYLVSGCMEREASPDFQKMCSELLPYCTENEKKQIEQIRGFFQSMEMYREMSRTMDAMKDFMPDMSSFMGSFSDEASAGPFDGNSPSENTQGNGSGGFDMMNMLMNMLTPEQRQMYEMFGGDHHAE
ncbi:hypothetical protein IMSAGC019_01147 [Lachnospiraceae bacterium]|nr:hypothetical protein IMSAGC019_01147 [Lachnospiraceae bacterium]